MKRIISLLLLYVVLLGNFSVAMADGTDLNLEPPSDTNYSSELPAMTPTDNNSNILRGMVATAPTGTTINAILANTISSATNKLGDSFIAKIDSPLVVNGATVLPSGSEIIGQITHLDSAGRVGKHGVLSVRFTTAKLPDGSQVAISGKLVSSNNSGTLQGGTNANRVAASAGTAAGATAIGAVGGTALGGILGSVGSAAVFGTAAGGLAGLSYMIIRKGKDITIPAGTNIGVLLDQPLTVSNSSSY